MAIGITVNGAKIDCGMSFRSFMFLAGNSKFRSSCIWGIVFTGEQTGAQGA